MREPPFPTIVTIPVASAGIVSPFDALAFASALAVIATASLAACVVPACRSAHTDPALVLRD